ncbi:MAG: hypothetical protein KKB24_04185 [Candidatus Altiarchaeota archaeon]|nr:hypothetical protein [Candidatus Altiarchaeota archaeon]
MPTTAVPTATTSMPAVTTTTIPTAPGIIGGVIAFTADNSPTIAGGVILLFLVGYFVYTKRTKKKVKAK